MTRERLHLTMLMYVMMMMVMMGLLLSVRYEVLLVLATDV